MRKLIKHLIYCIIAIIAAGCATPSGNATSADELQAKLNEIINEAQNLSQEAQTIVDEAQTIVEDLKAAEAAQQNQNASQPGNTTPINPNGSYTSKDQVALYIHTYGKLPKNFITKQEAQQLGWEPQKNNLAQVAPGKSIGGDKFGNYEGQLPKAKQRKYYECDIDYKSGKRNAKRIVFSSDGLVFYTGNHYETFTQIY